MGGVTLQVGLRGSEWTHATSVADRIDAELNASGCASGDPKQVLKALRDSTVPGEVASYLERLDGEELTAFVDLLRTATMDTRYDILGELANRGSGFGLAQLARAMRDRGMRQMLVEHVASKLSNDEKAMFVTQIGRGASLAPEVEGGTLIGRRSHPNPAGEVAAQVLVTVAEDPTHAFSNTVRRLQQSGTLGAVVRAGLGTATDRHGAVHRTGTLVAILVQAAGASQAARAALFRTTDRLLLQLAREPLRTMPSASALPRADPIAPVRDAAAALGMTFDPPWTLSTAAP